MTEHDPDLRFSLANERTFLAWGRTSLATIATGLLVMKILPETTLPGLDIVFGVGMILLGTVMGLWAYRNYRRTDNAIRSGEPVSSSSLPAVMLTTIVFAGVVALVL